jgi:hypothetical protein
MITFIIGGLFIVISQCMIINNKLIVEEPWVTVVSVVLVLIGIAIMLLPYTKKDSSEEDELDIAYNDIEKRYINIENLISSFPSGTQKNKAEVENLVVTDLFVEKDISFLSHRAKELQKSARKLFGMTIALLVIATFVAFYNMVSSQLLPNINELNNLYPMFPGFIKSFTAYGLIVLTAVTLWKQSKAKFDQAERILEKRRSNRLLRIYIHLHEGKINLDEMEKILNMGFVNSNAFSNIQAEGKAPWGALFTDVLKYNQELLKTMGDILKKNKDKPDSK